MRKWIALLLVSVLLCGCAGGSVDLMGDVTAGDPDTVALAENTAAADFAVRLFKNSVTEGENTLVSPLSVLSALAMTANGARGETLAQMEEVLGASKEELNVWLHSYMEALGDDGALHLANSIWFTEHSRFVPNEDFLQTNADYYGAGIYSAPFDASTVRDINAWVKKHTHGMIDEVLQEIPADAVMYLINALAFEAEWESIYEKYQVSDGVFTTEGGEERNVELMYDEVGDYLETENATGFLRYYEGRDYAFAALLPNEGVAVSDLVESLNGAELSSLLAQPQEATVQTAIPKFETESALEMKDILKAMGMELAFEAAQADFSGLGTSQAGNIFINRVLHKTYISVGERGTRAGAVTMVEPGDGAAAPLDLKTVYLDRPFVYMLIDCEAGLPFFIGTCMDIN